MRWVLNMRVLYLPIQFPLIGNSNSEINLDLLFHSLKWQYLLQERVHIYQQQKCLKRWGTGGLVTWIVNGTYTGHLEQQQFWLNKQSPVIWKFAHVKLNLSRYIQCIMYTTVETTWQEFVNCLDTFWHKDNM